MYKVEVLLEYILKNRKLLDASDGYYFIILNNNTNFYTNKLNKLY